MAGKSLIYPLVITVLIIAVSAVSLCVNPGPGTTSPGGGFYIKPSEYALPPGGMIAVVLTVENNDPANRSLYYNFNFEAIQTNTGKPPGEVSEWVSFNEDYMHLTPNEVGFKDSVLSVPSDAPGGEYVFHAYACYAETPEGLGECGKNSGNLWADPLKLTISVTD